MFQSLVSHCEIYVHVLVFESWHHFSPVGHIKHSMQARSLWINSFHGEPSKRKKIKIENCIKFLRFEMEIFVFVHRFWFNTNTVSDGRPQMGCMFENANSESIRAQRKLSHFSRVIVYLFFGKKSSHPLKWILRIWLCT